MDDNILQAHKDKFQALLNKPKLKQITGSKEHYFQKAVDKYNEYINLEVKETVLTDLIDKTKEKPFSWENISQRLLNIVQ